jgi:ribosomal protein S18 acetylase RimI-like enzyme
MRCGLWPALRADTGTLAYAVGMPTPDYVIRPAEPRDLDTIGRMGVLLLRQHYDFDRQRFMAPRPDAEQGYSWFLGTQIGSHEAVVCVAEREGRIVGYVYGAIEPLNWKELRDEAGYIHDVWVDEDARGRGIGTALMETASRWLVEHGVPRVLLWTAAPNATARRTFARLGFRETMIEMTREA